MDESNENWTDKSICDHQFGLIIELDMLLIE
jgi:hypothetical protein